MIITTDEKTARWRVDPRVQARAPISDPTVLSRAGGVRRGAVRGADLCGAYARGRGRWRGARRSPRQEGCSGSREGGLADWGPLSPSKTPCPSPARAQRAPTGPNWEGRGGVVRKPEIPLPIGCQGQGPPFRGPAQRPRGWAQTKAPGRPCPPRGGGWGPQTLRPTVGAGGSLPILMCPHRPRFKLLPCPSQAFFLSLGEGRHPIPPQPREVQRPTRSGHCHES